jgi:hypothetical protein
MRSIRSVQKSHEKRKRRLKQTLALRDEYNFRETCLSELLALLFPVRMAIRLRDFVPELRPVKIVDLEELVRPNVPLLTVPLLLTRRTT